MFLNISESAILVLLFWESIAIMSFILINYWIKRTESVKAAAKALLINKAGDAFLLIFAISFILVFGCGISNFCTYYPVFVTSNTSHKLLALLITPPILIKSVQSVLSFWLNDAMEGPSPVSALIHSSTMVIAGLVVLNKFTYVFTTFSWRILSPIMISSVILAAVCSFLSYDLKNILANSTLLQVSMLFSILWLQLNSSWLGQFTSHAVYKSALFILFGIMITSNNNLQDVRHQQNRFNKLWVVLSLFPIIVFTSAPFTAFHGYKSSLAAKSMGFSGYLSLFSFLLILVSVITILISMNLVVVTLSSLVQKPCLLKESSDNIKLSWVAVCILLFILYTLSWTLNYKIMVMPQFLANLNYHTQLLNLNIGFNDSLFKTLLPLVTLIISFNSYRFIKRLTMQQVLLNTNNFLNLDFLFNRVIKHTQVISLFLFSDVRLIRVMYFLI
ncbi:MAG: hypothetical protein GY679_05365, partial [Mycoplasma sp.]|nr:hypothetical protein [Mycoplasma sp.]